MSGRRIVWPRLLALVLWLATLVYAVLLLAGPVITLRQVAALIMACTLSIGALIGVGES